VPGMGGTGSQRSFQDNALALQEIRIVPSFLRDSVEPDTGIELFGRHLEHPILGAPMTGAGTNLKDALSERELALGMLRAFRDAGSIGWVGDGASLGKFPTILDALEQVDGFGVLICKPREDTAEILRRMQDAASAGVVAVGLDIDAVAFRTMQLRGQKGIARGMEAIAAIREKVSIPFILKGILNPMDAERAARAGVDYIVVSNHGGRVMDQAPGAARVLQEVADAWKQGGGAPGSVLADGGVRSGSDAYKYLALGATAVLVGRPSVIALAGGGEPALRFMVQSYRRQLENTMNLCGNATSDSIGSATVRYEEKA
ncbi:MAG: alpha-hydroxy-acid oxidizing protein, partial [Leptospiraceae bacterium]|nr:alpha-hydroxy-acid oxidizing protein [Leptospiraceae bacterium]